MTGGRRAVAAAVVIALAAAAIGGGLALLLRDGNDTAAPFPGLTEVRLDVGGDCRRIVVADAVDERATGLMRRSDLGPYGGMLFVFGATTQGAFTMSTVPVPLDIGFYDASGRPVDRLLMQPCPDRTVADCPSYHSRGPYDYALETLQGQLPAGGLSACP